MCRLDPCLRWASGLERRTKVLVAISNSNAQLERSEMPHSVLSGTRIMLSVMSVSALELMACAATVNPSNHDQASAVSQTWCSISHGRGQIESVHSVPRLFWICVLCT